MESSALNPPNSFAFTDTVIGSVMQSSRMVRGNSIARVGDVNQKQDCIQNQDCIERSYHPRTRYRQVPYEKPQRGYLLDVPKSPVKPQVSTGSTILSSIAELIGQTDSSTGRKRASCLSSDLKTANEIIASIQGTNHHITDELQQAIVAEALKKKIRHRERCRINQARYRKRQMKVETEIEDVIAKLKTEINRLEAKCSDCSRLPTTPTVWAIAAEYLRHFNYYVSSPATLHTAASTFLHGIMTSDVMVGLDFGVEAQLENWRLFALYFDDVQVKMNGMSMSTSDTLVVDTMVSITLTCNTLRRAFPHLNSNEHGDTNGGVRSPLAARMLGQKLVLRGFVQFGWDNATDKVVRLHFQADMMTPMVKLLGSLRDVARVFDRALITPDCRFVNSR